MARSRDAVDTIKGYYYQFDYFIFQLISLVNEEDTVTIEGIEDVDILEEKEMVAVQYDINCMANINRDKKNIQEC